MLNVHTENVLRDGVCIINIEQQKLTYSCNTEQSNQRINLTNKKLVYAGLCNFTTAQDIARKCAINDFG